MLLAGRCQVILQFLRGCVKGFQFALKEGAQEAESHLHVTGYVTKGCIQPLLCSCWSAAIQAATSRR